MADFQKLCTRFLVMNPSTLQGAISCPGRKKIFMWLDHYGPVKFLGSSGSDEKNSKNTMGYVCHTHGIAMVIALPVGATGGSQHAKGPEIFFSDFQI
jgi:hypothetical protein